MGEWVNGSVAIWCQIWRIFFITDNSADDGDDDEVLYISESDNDRYVRSVPE